EKDLAKIGQATASLGIRYRVALDSDYAIWRSFDNNAWPAFYFIGPDGRVRGRVLGERQYAQSERLIQKLLSEAGGMPMSDAVANAAGEGPLVEADWNDLRSLETYVGYAKAEHFVSPGGARRDAP